MKQRLLLLTTALTLLTLVGTTNLLAAGLVTEVVGRVDLVLGHSRLVIDSTNVITIDDATEWTGGLLGPADLTTDMVVKAIVVWQEDGSLLASSIELLGSGELLTLTGTVVDRDESVDYIALQIESGEWIYLYRGEVVLDGDLVEIAGIYPDDVLTAECVTTPESQLRALWTHVTVDPLRVSDENPWSVPGGYGESTSEQVLVILRQGADSIAVAANHGATVTGTIPGSLVLLFEWQARVEATMLDALLEDPDVVAAEYNLSAWDQETVRRRAIALDRHPTGVRFFAQRAVTAANVTSAQKYATGAETLVAVIDTGVDPFHPLLRYRIAPGGRDFVDNDDEPWETSDGIDQDNDNDVDEAAGHGTFVAGLVLLVAPDAMIVPYRAFNDEGVSNEFAVCSAMLAAMDRGVDVINMSFIQKSRPRILDQIIDEASRRGIVLVSGAGNGEPDSEYASLRPTSRLPFPADDPRVLAVAAADNQDLLADFSNYGSMVAVAAPGVDLYSGGFAGQLGTCSGTSMAAPLVSGAAALLRSLNPYLGPKEIEAALLQSAVPIGDEGPGLLQIGAAAELVPKIRSTARSGSRRH
jgi:subtilisin family serine protease